MAFSMAWRADAGQGEEERARGLLTAFRGELYWCLDRRPDALFELADAVLCKTGRPLGSKNRRPATRHDVGKTTKRDLTLKARRERTG